MSLGRAAVVVAASALVAAGLLAVASRTPARIRNDAPPAGATDPHLGARFTHDEIVRSARYNAPSYLAFLLQTLLGIVVLVVLARGPMARWLEATSSWPGGWVIQAAAAAVFVVLVTTIAAVPLSFVRGFEMEHAWGLSTQDAVGWFVDASRSLLVGAVTGAIGAVVFFGLVRWQPRSWWVWGWASFSVLTAVLVFLWPIVIAPLFNKFTPLEDHRLATRIEALASDAGVDVNQVLVADASRRSTAENAYVAGLGETKRMVLYDTLLAAGNERQTLFVVAHELGHAKKNHVLKGVAASSIGLLAGFAVLALLARREALWAWAGASGVGDVKALPLLLLYATIAGLFLLPAANALSRSFESQADAFAIHLTHDPTAAVQSFRRLALTNLADLRPPRPIVWILYTHPPIADRIESFLRAGGS